MSDIPNFVYQVQEAEHKLREKWQSAKGIWQDVVAERFSEREMEPYMQNYQCYITGEGIGGHGIDKLLHLMDRHLQDMDSLFDD